MKLLLLVVTLSLSTDIAYSMKHSTKDESSDELPLSSQKKPRRTLAAVDDGDSKTVTNSDINPDESGSKKRLSPVKKRKKSDRESSSEEEAPQTPKKKRAKQTLFTAIKDEDVRSITELLAAGANCDERGSGKRVALCEATKKGNVQIVRLLLDAGADANAADRFINSALIYAVEQGNSELVELLLSTSKPSQILLDRALQVACIVGVTELAKTFIDQGANIAETMFGSYLSAITREPYQKYVERFRRMNVSPLILASACGNLEIIKLLLDKKVSIDSTISSGYNPLAAAIEAGHIEIVNFLLENGAKIGFKGAIHPFIAAIRSNNLELVKLFMPHSNSVTFAKMGPLETALTLKHTEIAHFLLDNNSDRGLLNALCIATENGIEAIVDKILMIICKNRSYGFLHGDRSFYEKALVNAIAENFS